MAKTVLTTVQGKGFHKDMSSKQARALAHVLKTTQFDDDVEAIVQLISETPWFGDDSDIVLSAMEPAERSSDLPAARVTRRKMQNFDSIVHYFTETEWDKMQAPGCNANLVRHIIFVKIVLLGGRTLQEPSLKVANSMHQSLIESPETLRTFSDDVLKTTLDVFKQEFRRFVKGLKEPCAELVEALPPDVMDFKRQHPRLYAAAFPDDDGPIVSRISSNSMDMLNSAYQCREKPRAASGAAAARGVINLGNLGRGSSSTPMEAMANAFMQSMQAMQSSQQRVLDQLLCGRESQTPRRSLANLAGMHRERGGHSAIDDELETPPPPKRCNSALALCDSERVKEQHRGSSRTGARPDADSEKAAAVAAAAAAAALAKEKAATAAAAGTELATCPPGGVRTTPRKEKENPGTVLAEMIEERKRLRDEMKKNEKAKEGEEQPKKKSKKKNKKNTKKKKHVMIKKTETTSDKGADALADDAPLPALADDAPLPVAPRDAPKAGAMKRPAAALDAGEDRKGANPTYSDEATRMQFMARTGIKGPGQSKRFAYTHATKNAVEEAVKKYCRGLCTAQGVAISEKFV